jgi:MFS family permease
VARRREQSSTRIVFFVAGFSTAAWAPLVPFAKARAGIDVGTLGLLLLCLGLGSITAMPPAGALAARFGCRRVITAWGVPLCLCLPLLGSASNPALLAAALFFFGAAIGSIDVTMNIQAIIVERSSGRSMMSGFHGMFSIGGIVGPACVAAVLAAGGSPLVATGCVVTIVIVSLAMAAPFLLPYGSKSYGPMFALPHGIMLLIGILCFIAFLAEGAMIDWSAVFLTSVRGMRAAYAGLGYATFSLAMTVGRLTGDRIVQRLGGGNVIVLGGLCATAGFAIATVVPFWETTLVAYALVGIGCSNIVPVLFTSVGRQNSMPEHIAVPAMTTLGYAGILIGPAAIGFEAQVASLSAAFLMLTILQFSVVLCGRRVGGGPGQ